MRCQASVLFAILAVLWAANVAHGQCPTSGTALRYVVPQGTGSGAIGGTLFLPFFFFYEAEPLVVAVPSPAPTHPFHVPVV